MRTTVTDSVTPNHNNNNNNNPGQLENDSIETTLLKHIEEYPGLRYRQLLRLTKIVNGVLSYHLKRLERSDQIRVNRSKSKETRYYPINTSNEEFDIIGYIRNEPSRRIISYLLEHHSCAFNEIVEYTDKAPSTTSWHLKRLKDGGIVSLRYYRQHQVYELTNSEVVAETLYKYKDRIADKILDNYTQMIESL
jgi:predicted transcriptional regulator